jgi:hypothetical protein
MTTTEPPITPYDQLLFDVFATAIEGGINYWATVSDYHVWLDGMVGVNDVFGFYAVITDEEGDGTTYRIDRKTMAKGYELATTTVCNVYWQCERPPFHSAVTEDGWDHDALDADAVLQLGIFGKVIYG